MTPNPELKDHATTFKSHAVSMTGLSFSTSSNISIEEVKHTFEPILKIKQQDFGAVDLLAPSLFADQVSSVYTQFMGESTSYPSNGRNIDNLLFKNYPGLPDQPLVNQCSLDVLDKIDKRILYFNSDVQKQK